MADPPVAADGPFDLQTGSGPSSAPARRHGLPREVVEERRRNRLMAAALEVFTEKGYASGSIADLIAVAGVSRHTFYAHFEDKEACFLATYEAIVDWLAALARHSWAGAEDWAHGVVAVVGSLAVPLAADPRPVILVAVEALAVGAQGRVRHEALIDRIVGALRGGRGAVTHTSVPTHDLDPVVVAGAISVVARRTERGEGGRLVEFAPELSEVILAPYLGADAARELVAAGN